MSLMTDSDHPARSSTGSLRRNLLFGVIAAVIYFLVGRLSLFFAFEQANSSALWPTSGLAMGGLVVFGRRYWPAVSVGAIALALTVGDTGWGATLGIALGNTLEAVVGASLVLAFAEGANCLRWAVTVFRFIVCGALVAPLFSASLGVGSLALSGRFSWSDIGGVFLTWYTGNMAGVLVFAPLVFLWSVPVRRWHRRKVVEASLVLVALVLVGQAICGVFLADYLSKWPSAYMIIPVLLWAALRLGRGGTVGALIVLSAIAFTGSVHGFQVFPSPNPTLSLLYLQIFLSVVSMMTLVVGGVVAELQTVNESLGQEIETRSLHLQQMMREKDDLTAIAAHDLKAPLAGMRELLKLVRTRPETLSSETVKRMFLEMQRTTDGMLDLVSSLLVAKRAEELDMNLTLSPCDAVELLQRMVDLHGQVAVKRGIRIMVDAPQMLRLSTHPESFCQIASNLLANAVRFSPRDGIVRVGLRTDSDRRLMIFEVRDSGPGIPAGEIEIAFQKFRRANNQPPGGEPSHGIGLYIVEKLCSALHGEVRYTQRREGGARFVVNLPIAG